MRIGRPTGSIAQRAVAVDPAGMPIPVVTVSQMRAWESATWATGVSANAVIERVGRRIGEWLLQNAAPGDAVVFLAGAGHNGDDTRAAAAWLGWRRRQKLVSVTDPVRDRDPILAALDQAAAIGSTTWVVDGLFGIGLNRAFSGPWRSLIETINQRCATLRHRVVAVDVPSGLAGDEGPSSGAMIRATDTLTVGAPKRGLVGLGAAGRVEVLVDIGLPDTVLKLGRGGNSNLDSPELSWSMASDFQGFPPVPPAEAHKGVLGHLLIVAGSVGFHGAAVLVARAALRSGVGLITVVVEPAVYVPVACQLVQPMVRPWKPDGPVPPTVSAVAMGPGLASPDLPAGMVQWIRSLWRQFEGPVLADASALAWIEKPGSPAGPRLVTPHPGEAARLLKTSVAEIQEDRVAAVAQLRDEYRTLSLLKGHHSLMALADGVRVNPTGNSGLAQGGTGDVLTGFIGGWLARRLPPELALTYGVWEHGRAADRLSGRGAWTTDDLISELSSGRPGGRRRRAGGDWVRFA